MDRYLFAGVRAYPVFIALGCLTGIVVAAVAARRARLSIRDYVTVQAILTCAGLLGAKAHSLIEQSTFVSASWELTRGYRFPGGLAAVLMALPFVGRLCSPPVSFLRLGDVFAPSIAFAMAVIRIGCLFNGWPCGAWPP